MVAFMYQQTDTHQYCSDQIIETALPVRLAVLADLVQ